MPFCWMRPPPLPVAVLSATVTFRRAKVTPPSTYSPPPSPRAVLPVMVTLDRVAAASRPIAPPRPLTLRLPANVLAESVSVPGPRKRSAAALPDSLPVKRASVTVAVPSMTTAAEPPVQLSRTTVRLMAPWAVNAAPEDGAALSTNAVSVMVSAARDETAPPEMLAVLPANVLPAIVAVPPYMYNAPPEPPVAWLSAKVEPVTWSVPPLKSA